MDAEFIASIVEDYWCAFITLSQCGKAVQAFKLQREFNQMVCEMAESLPATDRPTFLRLVAAERSKLADEYDRDPEMLKARLGVAPIYVAPPPRPSGDGMGLGELAVRTAVRATIWEAIWSLFRLGR